MYLRATAVAVAVLSVAAHAQRTIRVPQDYPTIQEAINFAKDGDEVVVDDGVWKGPSNKNIDFLGLAITVRSKNGPDNCIIDCEGDGRGFWFHRKEKKTSVVDGFTITNGNEKWGGGIYCYLSKPTITNCMIVGNTATDSGGGISCSGSDPTIINCTIKGNTSDLYGGGISCSGSDPAITNCTVTGNTARQYGGGIYCSGSDPAIMNCTITGNTVNYRGGGLYSFVGDPTIINSLIAWNTSNSQGGGVFSQVSDTTITNCTMTGNVADYGGGVYQIVGDVRITNCILWGDEPDEIDGEPAVSFSDIQGGWPGVQNIDADPKFLDPENEDYHITAGSPCIDSADNEAVPEGIVTDLDGNPRFVDDPDTPDTGNGTPPIVDMGAYEFQVDEATEACCFENGDCEDLTRDACAGAGGVSQGPRTDCETAECGVNCDLIEKLKVDCSFRCRDGRYTIEASVVTDLPKGTRLTVTLDGKPEDTIKINRRGKGKAKLAGVAQGSHEVCIAGCPDTCRQTDCCPP